MTAQKDIKEKLLKAFKVDSLEVINESYMHNVPVGSESHFKVIIISEEFDGERLVSRHKRVNAVLSDLLNGTIHALALQTFTPSEWKIKGESASESPLCLGANER